jgi:hypothetical protein
MNLVYILRCVFFGEGLDLSYKPLGIAKVAGHTMNPVNEVD